MNHKPSIIVLHILVIFTFSSSFRFLFTSNAWFLVVLSLTNLLLNTSLCTVSLNLRKALSNVSFSLTITFDVLKKYVIIISSAKNIPEQSYDAQ